MTVVVNQIILLMKKMEAWRVAHGHRAGKMVQPVFDSKNSGQYSESPPSPPKPEGWTLWPLRKGAHENQYCLIYYIYYLCTEKGCPGLEMWVPGPQDGNILPRT